jgi:hypothetical protein
MAKLQESMAPFGKQILGLSQLSDEIKRVVGA